MDQTIKAGILGVLLTSLLTFFIFASSPVDLTLIPPFLVTIFVIAIYRIKSFKDGMIVSFVTYLFTLGILDTVVYAVYYISNQPFPSFYVDILYTLTPILWPISAVVAGYLGVWVSKKLAPVQESAVSSPLPPPPPSPAFLATP